MRVRIMIRMGRKEDMGHVPEQKTKKATQAWNFRDVVVTYHKTMPAPCLTSKRSSKDHMLVSSRGIARKGSPKPGYLLPTLQHGDNKTVSVGPGPVSFLAWACTKLRMMAPSRALSYLQWLAG